MNSVVEGLTLVVSAEFASLNFENFYLFFSGTAHKKLHAAWTMNGIVLPQEATRKTKPALSKRMRKMLATNTRRIMIFRNGDGMEAYEVVATPDKFDKVR